MQRRRELMARGAPFRLERQMQDGRVFNMNYRPLADGGWVTLVEDVTEFKRREYDLRVQFERFEQAVNHMSHGLCAVDSEHRIVLFNRLFLEMYDLSPDVIRVGVSMRDVIDYVAGRGYFPKASPERVWQRRLEKMAPRKPFQQYQNLSNGHEYILHYHPMDDGGWVTLCEDVTERHRMERELRLQFERFDQAISHMQHGLCMFDPDERLIVCNKRYLDIYGLDPAVIKPGVTHRELLAHWVASGNEPGMSAEAFYEKRKAVVTARAVSTMLLHLTNGRVIEATSRPTPDGGWVSAHEDVTERLGYEKMLREQNILLDAALENMAHGLCVFDKDWRVVVRNTRYLEMYGLRPDDAQPGTPLIELIRESLARGIHTSKLSAEEFFADFQRRVTEDNDARAASPPHRRPARRGAPSAARQWLLGRHLRGHHRARARRRRVEGAAPPLRYRAQQHGAWPVHVRPRHAADRQQQALCRNVQHPGGFRAARHGGARGHRKEPRARKLPPPRRHARSDVRRLCGVAATPAT